MKTSSRAYCCIREQPHYRREAFVAGLRAIGLRVELKRPKQVEPGDVLVVWNRYGENHQLASSVERQGGIVIVAENGYLGLDPAGVQMYALAVHGHNGSGWWPAGSGRFERLGVDVKPWRAAGEHLYLRGQRGIGSPEMASPANWHFRTAEALKRRTARRLIVRAHPGKPAVDPGQVAALVADLAGAHACLIWSSAAGVRALVEGIPVFYSAPHWICAGAARQGLEQLEAPLLDDEARARSLERMAWAQWSVAEIATGEPFAQLLECNFKQRGPEELAA